MLSYTFSLDNIKLPISLAVIYFHQYFTYILFNLKIIFQFISLIPQLMIRGNRSQTYKTNQVKNDTQYLISKSPRQSQPHLNSEEIDRFLKKTPKDELKDRKARQGRVSEVLQTQSCSEQFFSPKYKKTYESPSSVFLSPPHSKTQTGFIKCTSSNNLFVQSEAPKTFKKSKEGSEEGKSRILVLQNQKKTLDKIQQMLSNHGIQMKTKTNKLIKQFEQKPKKIMKTPRYSEHLVPDYDLQLGRKQTESFGNEKKNAKDSQIQPLELKQTVSTNSTFKNIKQIKITDFQIGKQIGRGRFGVVKLARDKKTGLFFAIKIIKKSMIKKQQIVEQFIKEIKIQYYLNHGNIVKLYTIFDDSENCYLLQQLCCDGNLYQRLLKQQKFTQNEARGILRNICQGLSQLHQNKIIHRDLKPENIVLHLGMAKICDFGWSTANKDNSLRDTFCGTPLYVSPELLSGNSYNEKVDLWSIGVLGYQMLTGRIPFEIKTQKDLAKIVESKIKFPRSMSYEVVSFLEDLLSKDPDQRKNIHEVLNHPFLHRKLKSEKQ